MASNPVEMDEYSFQDSTLGVPRLNTFKYHVSCTDGKISVDSQLPKPGNRRDYNTC